jgi:glutamate--cysteine ligase catalytic subunit
MLGVEGYGHTEGRGGDIASSQYTSDRIINPHPRFGTLTQNIRLRRGENVNIDSRRTEDGNEEVHMDSMAFGMGCCCLQITMQVEGERSSRYLHDQFTVLSPLLLALSASSPIMKGHLTDKDCRWSVISQSVDDRTSAERGDVKGTLPDPDMVGGGVKRLKKSRYSSISRYLGKPIDERENSILEKLNDIDAEENEKVTTYALSSGLDMQLAKHLGHLFTRDPLCIYQESIELDDDKDHDHFENIQGTNWRTMRWKLPAVDTSSRCPGEGTEAPGTYNKEKSGKKYISFIPFKRCK